MVLNDVLKQNKSLIITDVDKCAGCSKCIAVCPTLANESKIIDGKNKALIIEERCIDCGECIHACDHKARSYLDDTEAFFRDLKKGKAISIIAAPAVRNNFQDYKKLFGFLKSVGVKIIYDVSFGADITTWAYIRTIQKNNLVGLISQPCPVIVTYLEKYLPSVLPHLAPVHSPAICTAIYMKKYKGLNDDIAFLSPCIAKSVEFQDPNTEGYVNYNVTYEKIMEYLKTNHIDLNAYPREDFDNMEGNWGMVYSRPGGLKENVYFYMGDDVWVKQVENIKHVLEYFDQYKSRAYKRKPVPLLVDVLNCANGCNFGTGACNPFDIDDIDYNTNERKQKIPREHGEKLFDYFDSQLHLEDFHRVYANKSHEINTDMNVDIESVYRSLGKDTPESRRINCFACGYGSCEKFALMVANKHNHISNCINYARHTLTNSLEELDALYDSLMEEFQKVNQDVEVLEKSSKRLQDIALHTKIISINASVEAAHAGKFGAGFSVVANEVKALSDKSANIIDENFQNTENIQKQNKDLEKALIKVKEQMHHVIERSVIE